MTRSACRIPPISMVVEEVACPSFASRVKPSDGIHKANEDAERVVETSLKILALDGYLAIQSNVSCRRTTVANSDL